MLEAVIVVSVMVSAAVFVVTYDQPVSGAGASTDGLGARASDALKILYDTPVDSKFGDDALSAYIAECLNDDCDELESRLAKLLPPGASYALYVSNGYSTYPVIIQGEPTGEAVGATQAFEPRWSSTFVSTAMDTIGPEDPLLVYALPIYHSNVLSPGGSDLLVRVSGSRADGSDYVLTAGYSTIAEDEDDLAAIGAALTFVSHEGDPLPVHAPAVAEGEPQRITLRLKETEGGTIPAGAEVMVHVPRGWTAEAPDDANPAWNIVADATSPHGSETESAVRATLVDPLELDSVDLLIDITYHGDVLDYYPFVATMTHGASAVASMLIRGETHGFDPPGAAPSLHLSVPSPMGAGAEAQWTLSTYIPVSDADLGPDELSKHVHIKKIEIIEKEGNPIFADTAAVSPVTDALGKWRTSPSALTWEALDDEGVPLHVETALNLSFSVRASGIEGPQESRTPFLPPVSFDDFTGRLVERSGWGFARQPILPESDLYEGYESGVTDGGDPHTLSSDGAHRATPLPGSSTYHVSALGAIQDSLYGSFVSADSGTVHVGGEVVINANVQSLLFTLAEAGQRAGVTLRFYPPWSGDERVPIHEQENLDQSYLTGEVSKMIVMDINGDGFGDPVVGTTNGRVIAYHGLTGQRLQGDTYTVPVTATAQQQQAVPSITALAPITLYGEEYIVVATDKNSDGIFVLSKDFAPVWTYEFTNADTLAIDTSTDIDGDGQPDIIAARSYEVGVSKNTLVYALRALQGSDELVPITPTPAVTEDPNAFYYALGTPVTLLSQPHVGPHGDGPGILVPVQTLFDPGLRLDRSTVPPGLEQGAAATPRAGVQSLSAQGKAMSTLFGAPASVLRSYDHDSNGVDDVVLGGASGYVIMANGEALTQPIYSYIMEPSSAFIDGDARSSAETYVLSKDGTVLWTDDAWASIHGPLQSATGGVAIAANDHNSYWIVGSKGIVYKSVPVPPLPDEEPTESRYPDDRLLEQVMIVADRAGEDYDVLARLHDLADVWFRGEDGWIVGNVCATCAEPALLRTSDGGATWRMLSSEDDTLRGLEGQKVSQDLNAVEFASDGTGWIVGDVGTILRLEVGADGTEVWSQVATGIEHDLLDLSCDPLMPAYCIAVGTGGAVALTMDGSTWIEATGLVGLPTDKTLFSVGHVESGRAIIGSQNAIYASFGGSSWTALPLNYVENDAYDIVVNGDGTGFAYGGSDANGRIWLLHDYHIRSEAYTTDLGTKLPDCTGITSVGLTDGDVTIAQQTVGLEVSIDGTTWQSIGPVASSTGLFADARKPKAVAPVSYGASGSCELLARITLETAGDRTILSPHLRELQLTVGYLKSVNGVAGATSKAITLDFSSDEFLDPAQTTADWDTEIGALRQPLVPEFWTRDVHGEVHDIQTGHDVGGADSRHEVWVATGDILSENSPDYIIYAGSDLDDIVGTDDRVHLLDGSNGESLDSVQLDGEVRHIRLADIDGVGGPEALYAVTWDSRDPAGAGKLYKLDPSTLDIFWTIDLGRETPVGLELDRFSASDTAVFVATQRAVEDAGEVGHVRAYRPSSDLEWRIIADDLGKYLITKEVEPGWLFGPYVVEVEVVWSETVTDDGGVGQELLRSARFYDHFMVTPPGLVTPPTPVYTARLLVWMGDWH